MKRYFVVSLCKNGILGGGIIADSNAVTYKTGKVTVPNELRNLEMRYKDIESMKEGRIFLFPAVTLKMSTGTEYKFLVFAKKRFIRLLHEMGVK